MSSSPSAHKTPQVSPSREHNLDPVGLLLSQGGCLTHGNGQMLGPECGLMEISDVEYTHLQQFIQTHMEAQDAPPDLPDARSLPATVLDEDPTESTVISPLRASQAIDLSISTDEHCLEMPGEKTPVAFGEVPGFVLAKIRGQGSPTEPCTNSSTSSQNRSRSAARVCLEKRFNILSADTPKQQHIKSAVFTNFLTIVQQSAEVQEAFLHPQTHRWMKTDRANPFEVSSQFVGDAINPVFNMCEQVIDQIPHMGEPKGPNSVPSVAPDARKSGKKNRKRAQSQMPLTQSRERHNTKERERRKMIRLYCDELNILVPFCHPGTDKVSTLQWTTAFLRYINKTYGDTLKEEFQKAFADGNGHFLKSSHSSGQDPNQGEMSDTLSIPLAVEQ